MWMLLFKLYLYLNVLVLCDLTATITLKYYFLVFVFAFFYNTFLLLLLFAAVYYNIALSPCICNCCWYSFSLFDSFVAIRFSILFICLQDYMIAQRASVCFDNVGVEEKCNCVLVILQKEIESKRARVREKKRAVILCYKINGKTNITKAKAWATCKQEDEMDKRFSLFLSYI